MFSNNLQTITNVFAAQADAVSCICFYYTKNQATYITEAIIIF